MENKKFVFTIARMNPPTIGHLSLLDEMSNEDVDQIHVILSLSVDDENPLDCATKRDLLSSVTDANIVCMSEKTGKFGKNRIMNSIDELLSDNDYTEAILYIGDDRDQDYNWLPKELLKNYNLPLEIRKLPRAKVPVSATMVRDHIKAGEYDAVRSLYSDSGLDVEKIIRLVSTHYSEKPKSKPTTRRKKQNGGKRIKQRRSTRRKK